MTGRRRVAIVGMGVVSPFGAGVGAFERGLREGRSGIRRIGLFDAAALPVRIAGEAAEFDPGLVMDPGELRHVSRAVPMALLAAREAFEDAGLDPGSFTLEERRRTGVLIGSGGGPLDFTEAQFRKHFEAGGAGQSLYAIPSSTPGTIASEVSMRFDLRAESHLVSTGCTSSLDAVGYAARAIRHGDGERYLAGGVDTPLAPGIVRGFTLMKVLTTAWNDAPERGSRPFAADRDGFVLGEGAFVFVLEPFELALARGARIRGEIAGYGSTCEAFHRVRLREDGEEPARAMAKALRDAGLSPADVDTVSVHGTATVLNDRIEARALRLALGARADRVPMHALKSMIGHPQGASGAASLAASVVSLEGGFVPPTLNCERPDPACALPLAASAARGCRLESALVNTIGFGSKNSALVLRRAAGS